MATRLGVAPKTVGNHIEHIYAKIGVVNRVTASHFAVKSGLIPEEEIERPDAAENARPVEK
jgi:DNA-binding NarL/FixJ family response regulator